VLDVKLRILHLEDNHDDVELVRLALKRQKIDCDIMAVTNGNDYLSAIDNSKFDVILSDSGLPGYDGREALAVARDRCPDTPFIVLSGNAEPFDPTDPSETEGVTARLAKSDLKSLGGAIQKAVSQHSAPEWEVAVPTVQPPTYLQSMQHLITVVQKLALARDLASVQRIVCCAVRELTGADGATFALREGDHCHYVEEEAISPLWKGQRFPTPACVSGWAMLNHQSIAIDDIYLDPRIPQDTYLPTFVKSLVNTPIRTVNPIGAIGAYWAHKRHASPEEIRLLQSLADSASVAMETVDAFTHLERRVEERSQQLCQRSAELERLNHELEAFSYSVAHDLRSPLISIDGFSQLLLENVTAPFDRSRQDQLERIAGAARRMHGLISDLLRLSKIVRAPMRKAPVDLSAIAHEIIAHLKEREPARKADWIIAENLTAYGDASLLRIALENLLGNAWKFSSKCELTRIEVGMFAEPDGRFVYFVKDEGVGFDAARAKKLFTPFHRLHAQEDFKGTGMGLATVRRVIHRHGGEIWATAQVDQGATFSFSLPWD
jgi:signal transduction histidine kinase/DNA-binding NarL/FixJ family response regulator